MWTAPSWIWTKCSGSSLLAFLSTMYHPSRFVPLNKDLKPASLLTSAAPSLVSKKEPGAALSKSATIGTALKARQRQASELNDTRCGQDQSEIIRFSGPE